MKKALIKFTIVLLITILAACSQNKNNTDDPKESIIPVETAQAIKGDLVTEKTLYGRTEPMKTTPIMSQFKGEIDELHIENGDQVEKDEHIATLKTQMGQQKVKAPRQGEITQLAVEEGDFITEADPLAMIVDIEQVKVNFTVTSKVRDLIKKETTFNTLINETTYEADITSIGMMPDETGLYPIEAIVKNDDHNILPGMVATIHVPEKRIKDAIILPTAAIIETSDGDFIYIAQGDHVTKTEITILASQSDEAAVEGDVKKDDQVVINGQLLLEDGSKVHVVKEGNES